MLRNYLVVAVRNLFKYKLYSFINVVGLAVGLAGCIAIMLFVQDELSYDRWIPEAERIYRVQTRLEPPGRAPMHIMSSASPVLPALRRDHAAAVESGVRLLVTTPTFQHGGDAFYETGVLADAAFFDVFDLPFAAGDKVAALADTGSIVLSEKLARKYFADRDPIGEALTIKSPSLDREVRVTGVIRDLPTNTHLSGRLDFILPLGEDVFTALPYLRNWNAQAFWSYVKLRPGTGAAAIDLPGLLDRHVTAGRENMYLELMAVPDIRLGTVAGYSATRSNSRRMAVVAFSVVAAVILLIAAINFVNLATARATQRAREVALRKVLGARRRQLIVQFMGESLLMTTAAVILSLALVETLLPALNGFLGKQLSLSYAIAGGLFPSLALLAGLVAVAGGAYPALYLARLDPARILKPAAAKTVAGRVSVREALVVVQFAASIALITCTAVVHRQTSHVLGMDMGFERDGLVVVRGLDRPDIAAVKDTLQREIGALPGVVATSVSGTVPTDDENNEVALRRPGETESQAINARYVDGSFLDTYRVALVAGRGLEEGRAGDDFTGPAAAKIARGGNVVLTEKAVAQLGFGFPAEAVGQQVYMSFSVGDAVLTVVGVAKDVQYRSARDELPPTVFYRDEGGFENLSIRYEGVARAEMAAALDRVWRQVVPGVPLRVDHMNDLVERLYRAEAAQAEMFTGFSVLAILVACLGLYGLSFFMAERRTKEIGLRKVLGAKVRDIVRLLVWQLSKPITIAALIAWPIAYLIMRDWLDGFEFRISLSPVFFIGAGVAATLIAWATIMSHAIRVARANPIHALRYE